ncbi:response regulator transcription factor [Fangia hongkongensis]|uniref:response regulator transcription factor n=2 Tax=Fangia hongkongensis TaxID=270495 RepID=UPI000378943D|nr:response regulator transcription factor [Fangia hongkongensis]
MKDNNNTVLLVSTDQEHSKQLTGFLGRYLFEIVHASSGNEAMEILQDNTNPQAVILDLLLPDMYGIELCKNIRQRLPHTPIMFLSTVTDPTEIVLSFEAGADDYVEIPYNQHIFLARLKAKLRTRKPNNQPLEVVDVADININEYSKIQFGKWLYQPRKSLVTHPDYNEIYLTDKENALLKLLLSDPSRTFSREDIAKYLNLAGKESMIRDVNIHVHRLRSKLTQGHNSSSPIKAVRSHGYTLDSYLTYIYDGKEISCLK